MNTEFHSDMNYPSLFSPFKVGPYRLGHRLNAAIEAGHAGGIAFGRIFISNPDLPRRLQRSQ